MFFSLKHTDKQKNILNRLWRNNCKVISAIRKKIKIFYHHNYHFFVKLIVFFQVQNLENY